MSENQVGLDLKRIRQLVVHAVLIYWVYTLTPQRETEAVLDSGREVGLLLNTEKRECIFMSHHQNRG
jgi:hypothetical protein